MKKKAIIVSGYLRRIENQKTLYSIIPMSIQVILLSFYHILPVHLNVVEYVDALCFEGGHYNL